MSLSLGPDQNTFVSGACDSSAKVCVCVCPMHVLLISIIANLCKPCNYVGNLRYFSSIACFERQFIGKGVGQRCTKIRDIAYLVIAICLDLHCTTPDNSTFWVICHCYV